MTAQRDFTSTDVVEKMTSGDQRDFTSSDVAGAAFGGAIGGLLIAVTLLSVAVVMSVSLFKAQCPE